MRTRDCLRQAIEIATPVHPSGIAHIMRDELIGTLDMVTPGLFVLGRCNAAPASAVALGETLQEFVVQLHMREVRMRVLRLGRALSEQIRDALALPTLPQLMVAAAYAAPRV